MSWQQQVNKPLHPNLIWSRPETKLGAGKLLVIGGQAQEFIHVAAAYSAAEKAGAGSVRIFMPDSTRKITSMLPHMEYAPSNTSGSFSRAALAELMDAGSWADGMLLAGDLGKNSETSLMLESLITGYPLHTVIAYEALESITVPTTTLLQLENTTIVATFDHLQKIGIDLKLEKPIVSTVGKLELAQILENISSQYTANLIVTHNNTIWTASGNTVSSTTHKHTVSTSVVAAEAAVWLIQNPSKPADALATAVWQATLR